MRLAPEAAEPSGVGASRDPLDRAYAVSTPPRGIGGLVLQGAGDHLGNLPVLVSAWPAVPEFGVQALDAAVELAPLFDGLRRSADPVREGDIGWALGTGEDHPVAQAQGVGHGGGSGATLQVAIGR